MMELTLTDISDNGGFIPDAPVKCEIKFTLDDGVERSGFIHVKRLSIGAHESLYIGAQDKQSRTALLISETITLGKDGKEQISFKNAYKLHPSLAAAMIEQFTIVNNGGKKN